MLKLNCFFSGETVNNSLFVHIASGKYLSQLCADISELAVKHEGVVSFMPFKANFYSGDTEIIVEAIHIHGNIDYVWFSCNYKNKKIFSAPLKISNLTE